MKATYYFSEVVMPKRRYLTFSLIEKVVASPEVRLVQSDGRIRLWARMAELGGQALRVVLLPDGETVLKPFIDRDAPLPPMTDEKRTT